jgi:hypothetical protein
MEPSKVVCIAAVLFLVAFAFYKCPAKESFKVIPAPSQLISSNEYDPIVGLSGSTQRSGNRVRFADMVEPTPSGAPLKETLLQQMSNPSEYLPNSMAGAVDDRAFDTHAVVRLTKTRLSNTPNEIFNLGGAEIEPVQSIHKFTDHTRKEVNLLTFGGVWNETPHPRPTDQWVVGSAEAWR